MTYPQETILELMAYADGELDAEASDQVQKLLASDPEARQIFNLFASDALRVALVESETQRAIDAGADQVADRVMARLMAPAPVVRLDAARKRRAQAIRFGAAAGGALALAAGILLYVQTERSAGVQIIAPHVSRLPVAVATTAVTEAPLASAYPTDPTPGVEVHEVETPNNVSVFYMSSFPGAGAASVVIWLGDDPAGGK